MTAWTTPLMLNARILKAWSSTADGGRQMCLSDFFCFFLCSETICEEPARQNVLQFSKLQRTSPYFMDKCPFISTDQVTFFWPVCFERQSVTWVWSCDVVIKMAENLRNHFNECCLWNCRQANWNVKVKTQHDSCSGQTNHNFTTEMTWKTPKTPNLKSAQVWTLEQKNLGLLSRPFTKINMET